MSGINGTHVFTIRRMKCLVEKMQDESNDIGYVVTLDSDMDALNDIQAWLEKAARTNTIPVCDGKHDGGPCRDRECYVKPEAVGVIAHASDVRGDDPKAFVKWLFGGDEINLPNGTELYATPPQPQAAAVPDAIRDLVQEAEAACQDAGDQTLDESKLAQRWLDSLNTAINLLSAQPQTPGDGWVRCSERLPTEGDEDVCRQIWGWIDNKGIGGKWVRMSASEIRCMSENQAGPICKYWQHTGLRKPQPPQEG